MRELKTSEIGTVAGGTGWLDHRVTDGGRSVNDPGGAPVIGLADPLGNANTGYLGNNNSGAVHGMISTGQMQVGACGASDFGPCQLPSGNYVINGTVHGETTGNTPGDDVDWGSTACDLIWLGSVGAGPVTQGVSMVVTTAAAYCNSVLD
ncbi:MAG: hypothetical protein HRT80_04515 [Henriciella sp.]|nr:hypothetical protein [Henriciella sp.]